MSYTHICIRTPEPHLCSSATKFKKGDYTTVIEEKPNDRMFSGVGMEFKEDVGIVYDALLFLPLPPQQEKTVYISVPETILEEVPELSLN